VPPYGSIYNPELLFKLLNIGILRLSGYKQFLQAVVPPYAPYVTPNFFLNFFAFRRIIVYNKYIFLNIVPPYLPVRNFVRPF